MANIKLTEAKEAQRQASKRATLDMFKAKKRSERELKVILPGEDGPEEVTMLFRALGFKEYDDLIAAYPPTMEQKADGEPFNTDEFAPALLHAVIVDPQLEITDWKEIWNSDVWSRGELQQLYSNALGICTKGLDIPFTAPA